MIGLINDAGPHKEAAPFPFALFRKDVPSLTAKPSHLCGRASASCLSVFGFAGMSSKARMGAVSTRVRLQNRRTLRLTCGLSIR